MAHTNYVSIPPLRIVGDKKWPLFSSLDASSRLLILGTSKVKLAEKWAFNTRFTKPVQTGLKMIHMNYASITLLRIVGDKKWPPFSSLTLVVQICVTQKTIKIYFMYTFQAAGVAFPRVVTKGEKSLAVRLLIGWSWSQQRTFLSWLQTWKASCVVIGPCILTWLKTQNVCIFWVINPGNMTPTARKVNINMFCQARPQRVIV